MQKLMLKSELRRSRRNEIGSIVGGGMCSNSTDHGMLIGHGNLKPASDFVKKRRISLMLCHISDIFSVTSHRTTRSSAIIRRAKSARTEQFRCGDDDCIRRSSREMYSGIRSDFIHTAVHRWWRNWSPPRNWWTRRCGDGQLRCTDLRNMQSRYAGCPWDDLKTTI